MVESVPPLDERVKQGCQFDSPKTPSRFRKIPYRASQHRSHTHIVPRRIVVKGYGSLN